MVVGALRGAITVPENSPASIVAASRRMLEALIEANTIAPPDVVAAIFTATQDLDAAYPAEAARDLGWEHASLICTQEMAVPGSLAMCLRVLVLLRTDAAQSELHHRYLDGAASLRPDFES